MILITTEERFKRLSSFDTREHALILFKQRDGTFRVHKDRYWTARKTDGSSREFLSEQEMLTVVSETADHINPFEGDLQL